MQSSTVRWALNMHAFFIFTISRRPGWSKRWPSSEYVYSYYVHFTPKAPNWLVRRSKAIQSPSSAGRGETIPGAIFNEFIWQQERVVDAQSRKQVSSTCKCIRRERLKGHAPRSAPPCGDYTWPYIFMRTSPPIPWKASIWLAVIVSLLYFIIDRNALLLFAQIEDGGTPSESNGGQTGDPQQHGGKGSTPLN